MKIYAITHTGKNSQRREKSAVSKSVTFRNQKNDTLTAQKEYIKALNATKIERLLAKPFVQNLESFADSVVNLCSYFDLTAAISYDGNISVKKNDQQLLHANIVGVNDICLNHHGLNVAIGENIFRLRFYSDQHSESKPIFTNISDFKNENVQVENCTSLNEPIKSIYSTDSSFFTLTDSKWSIFDDNFQNTEELKFKDSFNKIFAKNSVVFCTSNREMTIYDEKSHETIISSQIGIKTNDLAFKDSFYFVTGNEDSFAYLHDMRRLEKPVCKYIGHVNAITSVDFIDRNIITGSADKTIRIFDSYDRKSRDVYYNKRMLGVTKVCAHQNKYILSGSDDGNVRMWRLNSSQKETISSSEKASLEENRLLKEKYYHVGDIQRIDKHRFLPGELKGKIKNETEHYKAVQRKKNRKSEKTQ